MNRTTMTRPCLRFAIAASTVLGLALAADSANAYTLTQTFLNPTPTANGQFGKSVALDGDRVLIGAPGNNANSGTTYLYNATSGSLLQTFLNPTPPLNSGPYPNGPTDINFGSSVALSGDQALIAAPNGFSYDGIHLRDGGDAFLYNTTTGNRLRTFDGRGFLGGDKFAASVALLGDRALIGAAGNSSNGLGGNGGTGFLYDTVTGTRLKALQVPNTSLPLGESVSLSENFALLRGSILYALFDANTGSQLQTFSANSATISGNRLLVAGRLDPYNGYRSDGRASLYDISTGSLLSAIPYDPAQGTVLLSGDRALFSSSSANYVLDINSGNLLDTLPGGRVAAFTGDRALIGVPTDDTGATDSGTVYLYSVAADAVPTPSLLPGLIGMGLAVFVRRQCVSG